MLNDLSFSAALLIHTQAANNACGIDFDTWRIQDLRRQVAEDYAAQHIQGAMLPLLILTVREARAEIKGIMESAEEAQNKRELLMRALYLRDAAELAGAMISEISNEQTDQQYNANAEEQAKDDNSG